MKHMNDDLSNVGSLCIGDPCLICGESKLVKVLSYIVLSRTGGVHSPNHLSEMFVVYVVVKPTTEMLIPITLIIHL